MPYIGNGNVHRLGMYKMRITGVALAARGGKGGENNDQLVIGLSGDQTADFTLSSGLTEWPEDVNLSDVLSVHITRVAGKIVKPVTTTPVLSPDAPVAAGAYAQADIQALVDLTNELKVKVSTLLNDVDFLHGGAVHDLSVVKGGDPFQIVVSNLDAVNDTPELDIEISYAHSRIR